MKRVSRLVGALAVVLTTSVALAQSGPTGALNGRVVDRDRAAIPGASVALLNLATNDRRMAVTNNEGLYRLSSLPPGTYELTIALDGFRPVKQEGVQVEAAVPRTID